MPVFVPWAGVAVYGGGIAGQEEQGPLSRVPVRQFRPAYKFDTLVLGRNDFHSTRASMRHENKGHRRADVPAQDRHRRGARQPGRGLQSVCGAEPSSTIQRRACWGP